MPVGSMIWPSNEIPPLIEEYGQRDSVLKKVTKAYDNVITQARQSFRKIKMREAA